jgi:hypothetical protein
MARVAYQEARCRAGTLIRSVNDQCSRGTLGLGSTSPLIVITVSTASVCGGRAASSCPCGVSGGKNSRPCRVSAVSESRSARVCACIAADSSRSRL